MRATRVRAGGWVTESRSRNVVGLGRSCSASTRRNAIASGRPNPMCTARLSAWNSALRPTVLEIIVLSTSPDKNTHPTAVSRADTRRPTADSAAECDTKLVVAADATFCRKKPMRASNSAGTDNHWPSGVQAEMMAEFVCQHSAQLVARQRVERERGDHHQVATAREGVELVRRQHGDDIPACG